MNFNSINLGSCTPPQIATLSIPVNDITNIGILGCDNCEYDRDNLLYSYSFDGVTWSCFGSYKDTATILEDEKSDYWLKIKVNGPINNIVEVDGDQQSPLEYTTQIAEGFKFDYANLADSSNMYNPYANMEAALEMQAQLNEAVSAITGIPAYYFKLSPNVGSKDLTFKEYALMDVEAVKLIKIIIKDGQMPSSKPEFADFGLEWATDWGVEVTKITFATAFGPTSQPMEGDLVYIPMMKRMWMVSSAYEEKNGALMWNGTTFTLNLVKYQEKGSVDLGDAEDMVSSFVKNKYEDLFGDQEYLDSGEESVNTPIMSTENLYPIYESDAVRKWISVSNIDIITNSVYYKGTLIADNHYKFNNVNLPGKVIYQKKYCGCDGSLSFIIFPTNSDGYEDIFLEVANLKFKIKQLGKNTNISLTNVPEVNIDILAGQYHFVWLRWSSELNQIEIGAAQYSYPDGIPLYKLQNYHYYFDMDNLVAHKQVRYDIEMAIEVPGDVILHQFYGMISNFKLFDVYNENLSEMLQQYPNHQHLLINDTARKLLDRHGPGLK